MIFFFCFCGFCFVFSTRARRRLLVDLFICLLTFRENRRFQTKKEGSLFFLVCCATSRMCIDFLIFCFLSRKRIYFTAVPRLNPRHAPPLRIFCLYTFVFKKKRERGKSALQKVLLIYLSALVLFAGENSRGRSCWSSWCVVCRLTTLSPITSSWSVERICKDVTWPADWLNANNGPSAPEESLTSGLPSPVSSQKYRNCKSIFHAALSLYRSIRLFIGRPFFFLF